MKRRTNIKFFSKSLLVVCLSIHKVSQKSSLAILARHQLLLNLLKLRLKRGYKPLEVTLSRVASLDLSPLLSALSWHRD